MSDILINLPFFKLMDNGTFVLTHDGCLELAKRDRDFHSFLVEKDNRLIKYNRFTDHKLTFYDNQEPTFTKQWKLAEQYKHFDVLKYCLDEIIKRELPLKYKDRVEFEYTEFEKRGFVDSLRFMKMFVDILTSENIMWGVGRGSSCASLLLYLINVNRIDPVEHDIPIEEFLK